MPVMASIFFFLPSKPRIYKPLYFYFMLCHLNSLQGSKDNQIIQITYYFVQRIVRNLMCYTQRDTCKFIIQIKKARSLKLASDLKVGRFDGNQGLFLNQIGVFLFSLTVPIVQNQTYRWHFVREKEFAQQSATLLDYHFEFSNPSLNYVTKLKQMLPNEFSLGIRNILPNGRTRKKKGIHHPTQYREGVGF